MPVIRLAFFGEFVNSGVNSQFPRVKNTSKNKIVCNAVSEKERNNIIVPTFNAECGYSINHVFWQNQNQIRIP
jgi:hypothetical protein